MTDASVNLIPPLRGCLYCHTEGTTELRESRKVLGLGSDAPTLHCTHCGSTAWLEIDAEAGNDWRINYRRVNRHDDYFYVALYLGKAGWLTSEQALTLSTDGFVQRQRVQQARRHDLGWLHPGAMETPPPGLDPAARVYVLLRGVTLKEAPPPGPWNRADPNTIKDSGKFIVTDQQLCLVGQRASWSHSLENVMDMQFDARGWTIDVIQTDPQAGTVDKLQFRGQNARDQLDGQLLIAVIESLRANLR